MKSEREAAVESEGLRDPIVIDGAGLARGHTEIKIATVENETDVVNEDIMGSDQAKVETAIESVTGIAIETASETTKSDGEREGMRWTSPLISVITKNATRGRGQMRA